MGRDFLVAQICFDQQSKMLFYFTALEPIHKLDLVIEFVMNESRQEMKLSNDLI